MKVKKLFAVGLATLCAVSSVYAAKTTMQAVAKNVNNIDSTMADIKANSKVPVAFPAEVPVAKTKLYASDTAREYFWAISVDSSAICKGTHYCNVGLMSADAKGQLEDSYMDMKTKKQTKKQSTMLADGVTAYFTPGHAEGDWHSPTLEWVENNALYTLTWAIKGTDAEEILKTMANSAMHPGSG